jgi:tryptophan 2-monooxygenase
MAVLPTLRIATQCPPSGAHPYIDTPDFMYDAWLSYLDQQGKAIGTVPANTLVAVIGAGCSGMCAALELQRAGCAVTVFEQDSSVGGRARSNRFLNDQYDDEAELGAMRFPPTEFILDHYLRKTGLVPGGLCSLPDFPDPGSQNPPISTFLCYQGEAELWQPPNAPPPDFNTVSAGWSALMSNGVTQGGQTLFQSAGTITQALAAGNVGAATGYWQEYINRFGSMTFYSVMYELFSGNGISGYDIPGGTAWTPDDFTRFGELGVGSGGFGPLYPISFLDIFRLIVNELETTQKFLQPNPSTGLTAGIRSVPLAFAQEFQSLGGSIFVNTAISTIERSTLDPPNPFTLYDAVGNSYGPFAKVIVATTTRAMELTLNLTNYTPVPLVAVETAQAIMRTHIVSSNKVAVLIANFWANNPSAPRVLLTDNMLHQVYTLDYTPAGAQQEDPTGVCFISYVWDDDAIKQQSLTSGQYEGPADNQSIYTALINQLLRSSNSDVVAWAQNLLPLNSDYTDYIQFEEWQSNPYFGGAFKLSQPGQDLYVQQMFFDYLKCVNWNDLADSGLYIAGDCIAWTSGWVEGGLQTALNAACGVIVSAGGTVNTDENGHSPLTIDAARYNYNGIATAAKAEPALA